ncbi:MAG: Outer membrane protein assembly factor BamD [Myxococcota bacterium]|nr:Outer membrane protein assembly factor BamD [Myxococcota bacterium]
MAFTPTAEGPPGKSIRRPPPRRGRLLAMGLVLLGLGGCAAARKGDSPAGLPDEEQPRDITMPELKITAGPAADPELAAYDDATLHEKGLAAFKDYDYPRAARFLSRLNSEYPQSEYAESALYHLAAVKGRNNQCGEAIPLFERYQIKYPSGEWWGQATLSLGLCKTHLKDYDGALAEYDRVLRFLPGSAAGVDALFYRGEVFLLQERWQEAKEQFAALIPRSGLVPSAIIEAHARLGRAHFGLGEMKEAEHHLNEAVTIHRRESRKAIIPSRYAAEAAFYLAEIKNQEYRKAPLTSEKDKLESQLETKAALLLEAQDLYVRAVRYGDPLWAGNAGLAIGGMYRDLYDTIYSMPVPEELTPPQKQIYRKELHRKLQILLSKAIRIYEGNLDMAQRVGANDAWVASTRKNLEELKKIYLSEPLIEDEPDSPPGPGEPGAAPSPASGSSAAAPPPEAG